MTSSRAWPTLPAPEYGSPRLPPLAQDEPQRHLYLAIAERVYEGIFHEPLGQLVLAEHRMSLVVFNPFQEVIVQWIA